MKLKALVAALALVAGLAGAASAQQPRQLKLGHSLPPTSHYGVAADAMIREIAQRSNNRFQIQQFPASALGGEREMVEGTQLGTVDLVITSTGPVGNFVPEVLITDIPFLFRDYAHARAVLDGPIGQQILAAFPARNLRALAWAENGFRHMTNSRRPVNTPDDLRGLKIRTMENQVHMTAFRTLGALPTPMAFPEVPTALQQGTVDGQENPIPVIVSARLAQVQRYLTLTAHVYSPALILIAPSLYDSLSEADKQMFTAAALVAGAASRAEVTRVEQSGIAELRAAGMQVVEQVDNGRFQQALGPAYAEYARRFGEANIDRIRNFR